ncbi:MAG: hypothetical protein DWQ31_15520 [Planctomycetota bacterium]|nr:MAG: hypothetical protein DWQ31_15520 [Planctomycetota bacterium]REJ89985.1 MAG: hypothetical protein DWQ35_17355 [Planctomycetota bacterium]REK28218.1 MAG: hypothetical protein DWQ42_05740 [Planctomycetota bacterium]REK39787.1 MAG: hypothetical protein DWQ46_17570 [Planctomycetota bacterium]
MEEPIVAEVACQREVPFHERRWVVVCAMLFAALFLGFPLLWRSRAFSTLEKIFWTIVVSLETVVVFWAFWRIMQWCYERLQNSLPL